MSRLSQQQTAYQARLYELLPTLYRARDTDEELRQFLEIFGGELARLRCNVDLLWQDFYIDSCQDWVVPYIGDLVGTNIVSSDGEANRLDVKNTIRWRRQKGTLPGLEDVAAVISGWGAKAEEMFERLVWSQNLNHLRPQALHAVDLPDPSAVARISTPFELALRSVDLRPPDHRVGWHQLRHLAVFLWRIPSFPWQDAEPTEAHTGGFRFHPLGLDTALHGDGTSGMGCAEAKPEVTADVCHAHTDDTPIRARDFRDNPKRYFGDVAGFTVFEDGIPLCLTETTAPKGSRVPATLLAELAEADGIVAADQTVFGGNRFLIDAIRLGAVDVFSPAVPLSSNLALLGPQGRLDTNGFVYAKGLSYQPSPPDSHHPALMVRVARPAGAPATFPECEVIFRSATGSYLQVYLPEVANVATGSPVHFYAAEDGSTYFARGDHGPGDPDRNPDGGLFGAFLPLHLARESLGQARLRPGVARPVGAFDPAHFRRAVYRPLCCWDQPLQLPLEAGDVAFDPERGRFAFPPGEEPAGKLTVDFRFGMTGEVGAGPFTRVPLIADELTDEIFLTVAQGNDADHSTIQAALNAAAAINAGAVQDRQVVIEIQDSATYDESLLVQSAHFSAGVAIQARRAEMPVVRATGAFVLRVTPAAVVGQLTADGKVVGGLSVDGLVMAGGSIRIDGDVVSTRIAFSTLEPETVSIDMSPADSARLEIVHSVVGVLGCSALVERIEIADSAVHHPLVKPEQPGALTAISAQHAVDMRRTTVLGGIDAGVLTASDSILVGELDIDDGDASCIRFSRYPVESASLLRSFNATTDFPIFVSTRLGHPAFLHLHPNTSTAVLRGGENGGEMGAFYSAGIPLKEQNTRLKLAEYTPAGLRPVLVPSLPRRRFIGVARE